MKAENTIKPYLFKYVRLIASKYFVSCVVMFTNVLYCVSQEYMQFEFTLKFSSTDRCLPLMCQLQRASTLPVADQTAMIHAIVSHRQHMVSFDMSW